MPSDLAPHVFPGPAVLGRGVVVGEGDPAPDGFPAEAPRVLIDTEVLQHPGPATAFLHHCWATRTPVVIELAVANDALRAPQTDDRAPWELPHGFTFDLDRLHFLIWANTYDARGDGAPVWWHGVLAQRRGAAPPDPATPADAIVDGQPVWCDGGPRGPIPTSDGPQTAVDGARLLHRESIRLGRLTLLGEAAPGDDLAPDQLAAVAHASGAARIVAPAGSGKTRVLTARLRHLVRDRRVEPDLVTAVAYNTRAAGEMRDRLGDVRANVRTLHSLGLSICNLERRREMIDERDQRSILDRLVSTAKIPNTDPFQVYLDGLSEVRLGLRSPDDVAARNPDLDEDFPDVFRRYRAELARRDVLDFDEQIFHALEVLLSRPDIRDQVQQRCAHLLVDEFQDLTPAFHLLVRLVGSPALQVFAVGDDDQVIYGYAGADPAYLIDFARDFPGADDHPLTINYRCPPAVVTHATTLLSHNRRRVVKDIHAGRDATPADVDPAVHTVETGAMARRAVAVAEDWLRDGATPSDLAVLARVNASLLPVQVALTEARIPHTAPLDASVLGRTGIRTALAYLRLGLDDERMRREDVWDTLNRPARKVKSAVKDHLKGSRWSWDQLAQITDVLTATHSDRWQGYLDDIALLSKAITDGADTERCLWLIRNAVGLGEAMDTLDASSTRPEGSSHGDDLDALQQLAALHPDPASFREWLVEVLRRPADPDGVTLSTVHRVKGMEWDRVIVFGANSGLFPHRLADDVEEERRVFHVAITRCRTHLTVIADREATSPFVPQLATAFDGAADAAAADTATSAVTARPAEVVPDVDAAGTVAADPGVSVILPGGVPGTVVGRVTGPCPIDVDVVGARVLLGDKTPVRVGDQTAVLVPPAPVRRVGGTADGARRLGFADDSPAQRALRSGGRGAPAADDLDEAAQSRFDNLKEWRRKRADADGVPPYVVFHDAHLRAIAQAAPTSLITLSRCPGVGPTKLDRYGDEVLEVLEA